MSIINIDPSKDIQSQINSAPSGSTLLFPTGEIKISRWKLKSGIALKGQNTILVGGPTSGGYSGSSLHDGWIVVSKLSNVEISGFTFKSPANKSEQGHGNSRNCIYISESTNIKVHDLIFKPYLYSDAIRVRLGDGCQIWNCIGQCGHDFISLLKAKNVKISNCKIDVCINTGVRFYYSVGCTIEYSTVYCDTHSGWNGLQIQGTQQNCLIDHCILRNMHGSTGNAGIQYYQGSGTLTVSNCVGWDLAGGFVNGGKPTLKNNKFDSSVKRDEGYWVSQGVGFGGKK
jgi:hypothetical protein